MNKIIMLFLKRLTWDDVRKRSSSDDEAYRIMEAIQEELEKD